MSAGAVLSDPSPAPMTAAAASAALSAEQLMSGLWADARLRVYGMVLGLRVAGLPERLAQADGLDYHCLVPGALSPAQRLRAPYLVELRADSSFSRWLLLEAAAGFGDWGVVARSSARMLEVRSHARDLRTAASPEGRIFRLDWMDPAVLDVLLSSATPDQLQAIFARLDSLTVTAPQRWREYRLEAGRLQPRSVDVLRAG
jgi:hypothetical protein